MMRNREKPRVRALFQLAFDKRPPEELYDLKKDPFQMNNVAAQRSYENVRRKMAQRLQAALKETQDPRALGGEAKWDQYPYYGNPKFRPREGAPLPEKK
jgi:hypothetical protein